MLDRKTLHANGDPEYADVLAGKREESNRLPISGRVSNGTAVFKAGGTPAVRTAAVPAALQIEI